MHDVAGLAGVSIATVSALINGTPKVSEVRAQRIRNAMQALNYYPDQIARSLKMGRTQTIGVVIPDITNDFYPAVFSGIEDAARSAGYSVLLCNSNESAEQESLQLRTLLARRVDGVLLACSSGSNAYEMSLHRHFPLIFVDRIPQAIAQGAICTDNVQAGLSATEHLIALGHRRIALLAGDTKLTPHAERLEGFRKAMQRAAVAVHDHYLCVGGMQIEDGRRLTAQLLRAKVPPTSIIASNGKLLLGLLHVTREKRKKVPSDLSVLGFDEHEWSGYVDPPITAMVQPTYELGRRAFGLLEAKISPEKAAKGLDAVIRLHAELRVRSSTDKPATGET
jgi:LacI family transcriptional regulator